MNKSGRNYWNEYKKTGELPIVSPEDKKQDSATDTWNIIYQSMTPFERGTFNARQRKEKEIAKTSGEIGSTFFQNKLPTAKTVAKKILKKPIDQRRESFNNKSNPQVTVKNKKIDIIEYIDTMKKRYNEK